MRFSIRTIDFWNLLPKEIRDLRYDFFKKEAKKFVVNNKERFLNLGNKDKTGPKYLPKLIPYVPPKLPTYLKTETTKPLEALEPLGKKKVNKKASR